MYDKQLNILIIINYYHYKLKERERERKRVVLPFKFKLNHCFIMKKYICILKNNTLCVLSQKKKKVDHNIYISQLYLRSSQEFIVKRTRPISLYMARITWQDPWHANTCRCTQCAGCCTWLIPTYVMRDEWRRKDFLGRCYDENVSEVLCTATRLQTERM